MNDVIKALLLGVIVAVVLLLGISNILKANGKKKNI
jgi:hypothetical protein